MGKALSRTRQTHVSGRSPCADKSAYRQNLLFYDRSRYTGVHKHGGPVTHDVGGTGIVLDLQSLTRPGLRRGGTHFSSRKYGFGTSSATHGFAWNELIDSLPNHAFQDHGCNVAVPHTQKNRKCNGPQRFFYDHSTYTGTHRYGGPHSLSGCFRNKQTTSVLRGPCRDESAL